MILTWTLTDGRATPIAFDTHRFAQPPTPAHAYEAAAQVADQIERVLLDLVPTPPDDGAPK